MGKKRIITKKNEEGKDELEKKVTVSEIKVSKQLLSGRVYVNATYNNTIITVTDNQGNTLAWGSAGNSGFKGTKKSTPYAASKVGDLVAEKLKKNKIGDLTVYLRGVGSGRESAIRSLAAKGLNITAIKDITAFPHNGPRPPKRRRV